VPLTNQVIAMDSDCWASIDEKLESAESHLREMSMAINPALPSHIVAAQLASGVDVSDPRWWAKLSSHVSAFVVDCRSVLDILQSCFGADPRLRKWLATLSPDEQLRRRKFQIALSYKSFGRLRMSRARVDTVHRIGFVEIWVRFGKRFIPLQKLDDAESKHILAGSDPASQWAATLPPQRRRYLPNDFFFKTAGGRYKPLFPECQSYLRRTVAQVKKARQCYDAVHQGTKLTEPPRTT
jgi:hypothetical protein